MTKRGPALAAILLLAAAPAAAATAGIEGTVPLAQRPEVASRLALFEIWVGEQMAYRHQPGLSVGIVHDQELVWARGFGLADVAAGRPAAADTVYRIGSITKTFTAVALLQLRDVGKLGLDDPVSRHLPELRYRNPYPDESGITVRHLLTHTSGLPRESAFPYWTDRKFPSREQMFEALAAQEGLFPPGTDYQYSNLAMALAGEVVAAVSGERYADFVRRRILAPLGMTSTFVDLPRTDPERLATGYLVRRPDGSQPPAPQTEARGLTPSANMSSTVEDLARFVSAQFTARAAAGGLPQRQILRTGSLAEMHRVHWLAPSWTSGRGLGFSVWRQGERTLVGHGGWVAGHRSQIGFDPATRSGVIVLTNSDEGGPGEYLRQAFELVVPAIERAAAPPPPESAPPAEPQRYAGAYHNPWGEVSRVLVVDGRLVIYEHSYPPADDPLAATTRLLADGEHAFRKEADGRPGERVVFELLPDGRVARVKVGENYLFPAGCGTIGPDLQCTWD